MSIYDYLTEVLSRHISSASTRDEAATGYALLIAMTGADCEALDWETVNARIVERWSVHALSYIKKAAWKIIKANEPLIGKEVSYD